MFSWLKWLLTQVKAWFQVVMGVSDHESFQAPIDDPPVTASLGPIDRLIYRLQWLEGSKGSLPKGLSLSDIMVLGNHLKEFRNPLWNLSAMDDISFMAKWWMKEVRELCFDTEDYLVEVMMQFGAGSSWSLWNLGRTVSTFVNWKLKFQRPKLSQFIGRAIGLEEMVPKYPHEESKAIISHLDKENKATIETLPNGLINQLSFDDDKQAQLKVVAISGSAGAGKTALASNVYVKYKRKFQCRAFVQVSRNPDFRSIFTSILSQIKAAPSHDFPDVQGLIVSINKHLQRKRYFVVIDDIRSPTVWDIISRAFPGGDFSSRIIVTTQSEQVEAAYYGYQLGYAIFKIGTQNDGCKDSFIYNNLPNHLKTCLLYFSMYTEGCTVTKDDLVKQWVAEGFIVAVKRHHREESSQIPQNKIEEISEAPQDQAEEIEVVPQDENGEITKVPQKEMEKIAEGYFDELLTRGMIQPVDRNHKGDVLSCTVNHMVLDLIRYKSKEDNFIVVVDNLESTVGHPDIIRRLSIQFGSAKGASMPESIILSQVRSLAFYGFLGCVPSIAEYGLLRVLILNIWVDEDSIFDLSTIGELYHLRYLKTECNVTVRLPSKMQRLQRLGTLQVDARLCDVPCDIVHLEKLLHLRLPSDCILPHGIGRMTSLHSLGYFDLSSNSEDNVRGLNDLKNIQHLQLTCSTGEPAESLEKSMQLLLGSVLQKLSTLRAVTLAPASGSCNGNNLPDYGAVSSMSISCDGFSSVSPAPAHHLQRLELSRHCCVFSRLPKWLGELAQLCIVKIAVRELTKEDIDILKGLPAVAALSLHLVSVSSEMIVFGKGGFSVLTYFKFTCTVPWLKFEADAMPNLQKLRLSFIATTVDEQGGTAPIIIEHLSSGLKEISAKICSAGVDVSPALMKAIRNDPKNPEVQLMAPIYYDDEGRGKVAREGSVEDENKESHSRIQMLPKSSSLPVPAVHYREDDLEDRPSMCDTVSIQREPESTDGHTGQVKIDTLPKMGDQSVLERILNRDEDPKDLPLALLQDITDGFSEENIIGQGGFGQVYKGILRSGTIVAVKRMYVNENTTDDNLFRRELQSLRHTNHQNVVRFLGFCSHTYQSSIKEPKLGEITFPNVNERLLCLEYISNGSLDMYITDELRGLEWEIRYEIITGICKGLCYLHMEKHIIHMDLKPSNILLDDHMVPKIMDFGLSRLDENSHIMEQRFGTPGYIAPEYMNYGKTSYKCDIYGLGVIITELITGCIGVPDKHNVLRRWRHRWKKLQTLQQYQQVTRCIDIAVQCRQQEPGDRPSILDIIRILSEPERMNWHTGQASPCYNEDDMLGIEPLELRVPYEIEEIACSIQLTNDTRNCIAFNILLPSKQYNVQPYKGIVQPGSKYCIKVTTILQQRDAHGHNHADKFIVQSIKVSDGLRDEDITEHMFHEEASKGVDEVVLMVLYEPMKLQELCKSRDNTNIPDKGITHGVDPRRHTAQVVKGSGPDNGIRKWPWSSWYGAISRTEFIGQTQQLVVKRVFTRELNYALTVALPITNHYSLSRRARTLRSSI